MAMEPFCFARYKQYLEPSCPQNHSKYRAPSLFPCLPPSLPACVQDRCVDLATELFVLKNKMDEQTKELKWARREAEAREKDFKASHLFPTQYSISGCTRMEIAMPNRQ